MYLDKYVFYQNELFPDNCPMDIFVSMKNDVFEEQKSRGGRYTKQTENSLKNTEGMPYWSNSEGTLFIWFKKNYWRIGDKNDLGTTAHGLKAKGYGLTCPDMDDLQWTYMYFDAEGEVQSSKAGNDLRIFPYSGKQYVWHWLWKGLNQIILIVL